MLRTFLSSLVFLLAFSVTAFTLGRGEVNKMVNTNVTVGDGCSGVIISHKKVLTAAHCIRSLVKQKTDTEPEERKTAYISKKYYRGMELTHSFKFPAKILKYDYKMDLALLESESDFSFPNIARLADKDFIVFQGEDIVIVGNPLGEGDSVTFGNVSKVDVQGPEDKDRKWAYPKYMVSGGTIFGNSGGAIFDKETQRVLGIASSIRSSCMGFGPCTPVSHMALIVQLPTIYEFLND